MKTSLNLDKTIWMKFRAGCIERLTSASRELERMMQEQIEKWRKENDRD